MRIQDTQEWASAALVLTPIYAKRTGVSHFKHIKEGIKILEAINAPLIAQQAFCLHPLIQKTEDFRRNLEGLWLFSPPAVALAVEYRAVANTGLRTYGGKIAISEIPEVNQMLIADKVQNRLEFETHMDAFTKEKDPESPGLDSYHRESLDSYFRRWLKALGVTNAEYKRLKNILIKT